MFELIVNQVAQWPSASDFVRSHLEGQFVQHREAFKVMGIRADAKTLDCGCGTGLLASYFQPGRYVGVDLDDRNIRCAVRRCPFHRFLSQDARCLQLNEVFDQVVIVGVLHHLSDHDVQRVLHSVRQVLQPSGRLYVCEDIPTLDRWNWVGRMVHRFDLGKDIRPAKAYRDLLDQAFTITEERRFRSGYMDYVCFAALPAASHLASATGSA